MIEQVRASTKRRTYPQRVRELLGPNVTEDASTLYRLDEDGVTYMATKAMIVRVPTDRVIAAWALACNPSCFPDSRLRRVFETYDALPVARGKRVHVDPDLALAVANCVRARSVQIHSEQSFEVARYESADGSMVGLVAALHSWAKREGFPAVSPSSVLKAVRL